MQLRFNLKRLSQIALLALSSTFAPWAAAQMTPVGVWNTIDDETGKPLAEVRISTNAAGELSGVVTKSLTPPQPGDEPNCTLCTDDRKDKPKLGIELIRGGKQTVGTEQWEGGTILDPNKGKVYKLRLMPLEGGKKLQIRGYIGPFYRTQVWVRVG
jgi:uncharacterized protein (DUF2147 family)